MTTKIPAPTLAATLPAGCTDGRKTVIMRVEPCRCGCKGADPWHRSTFKRVIRDAQLLDRPVYRWGIDGVASVYTVATGTIRCPWGDQQVRLEATVRPGGATSLDYFWKRADL